MTQQENKVILNLDLEEEKISLDAPGSKPHDTTQH